MPLLGDGSACAELLEVNVVNWFCFVVKMQLLMQLLEH